MVQNHPFREFFARALREGQLPLWNAAINCGFPLFAEGQAGPLYPPNVILALLLPTWAALNWNIVLHLWLAGVGMYALVRAFGAVRPAALCAGLCYALSGYMVVRAMSPNFIDVCAWLPLLFWLVESHPEPRALFLRAALCAGDLPATAGRPSPSCPLRSCRRCGLLALSELGAGRGVGGLAGAGRRTRAGRGSRRGPARAYCRISAAIQSRGRLVVGQLCRDVAAARAAGYLVVAQLLRQFGARHVREPGRWASSSSSARTSAWCPCFWLGRPCASGRTAKSVFFAVLGLAGLVLALGKYTAIFSLFYEIPGFSLFRIPTRFLLWFALGASVLCGLGLDQVLRRQRHRPANGWLLAIVLGAASVGLLWASGVALLGDGSEPTRYIHHLRGDGLRLIGALIIGAYLLGRRARRAAAWAAPVAIFAELYSFGADFNGTIEPAAYTETPATAGAILADHTAAAPPRIVSLVTERNSPFDWHGGWAYDLASYRRYNETLRMYSGGLYGVANALPGMESAAPVSPREFAPRLSGVCRLGRGGIRGALRPRGHGRATSAAALPRAYAVGQFHLATSPRAGLSYMARGFPMRREVVLEEAPAAAIGPGGAARIVRYEDEEVAVALADSAGGILVLSDTYYPAGGPLSMGLSGRSSAPITCSAP